MKPLRSSPTSPDTPISPHHYKSESLPQPGFPSLRFQQAAVEGTALVVEDHPLYRDAMSQLAIRVMGRPGAVSAAASAEEGLRIAGTLDRLKVVLLDIGLPGLSGIEAIAAFRRQSPDAALIAISASEDRREVTAAFRAGARAFISKSVSPEIMADVVRRAVDGRLEKPEWITALGDLPLYDSCLPELTSRQKEILTLLGQGHSNKEISWRLGRAEITIKQHVSLILQALGVSNRTQAVLVARRLGLDMAEPSGHDDTPDDTQPK
jgi:DNA-binding NarL/FixJ family response regulator